METAKKEEPYSRWDGVEVLKRIAEQLQEEDEALSDDKAYDQACEDTLAIADEWDYFTEDLTRKMLEYNPDGRRWCARVENFGWQKRDGYLDPFEAVDAQILLRKVLPETECTYNVFADDDTKSFRIQNWHHDSCTGDEWYYITIEEEDNGSHG